MILQAEATRIDDQKINTDIDTAQQSADTAQISADVAQVTADSKSTVVHQASAPSTSGITGTVTWYDTDNDNAMYVYDEDTDAWLQEQFDTFAIADDAITADKIVEGAVTFAKFGSELQTRFEDVEDTADAATQDTHLIYISKASGTQSVDAPSTWITSTSDSQNAWTTKRPTYNSSYPVLFVATQKKSMDGTLACTTPVKDDTVTVIDGGHITTGTIDASVVAVTNLDADNITSGTISADRISGDSISGKAITGASLRTNAGDLRYYAVDENGIDSGTIPSGGAAQVFTKIQSQGIANIGVSDSVYKSQLIPCYATAKSSAAQFVKAFLSAAADRFGWYATHYIYAPFFLTNGGPVVDFTTLGNSLQNLADVVDDYVADLQDQIDDLGTPDLSSENSYTSSIISGVDGIINEKTGVVTLLFTGFEFAANESTSSTSHRLPTKWRPRTTMEFCSSYIYSPTVVSYGRFTIDSSGYIRPVITNSGKRTIRGTFTYLL